MNITALINVAYALSPVWHWCRAADDR